MPPNNPTTNTANPTQYVQPGIGNAPSYQVSGKPWVYGATFSGIQSFSFPNVTKFVTITNGATSGNVKVGFSANGIAGNNYMLVPPGEAVTLEVKVVEIFVSGSGAASIAAGLTNIPAGSLHGNWSGSAGVG